MNALFVKSVSAGADRFKAKPACHYAGCAMVSRYPTMYSDCAMLCKHLVENFFRSRNSLLAPYFARKEIMTLVLTPDNVVKYGEGWTTP